MIEIFHDVSNETRLEIGAKLTEIFNAIDSGKYNSAEAMAKLKEITDSCEDENIKNWCTFTIQATIMRRLKEYE